MSPTIYFVYIARSDNWSDPTLLEQVIETSAKFDMLLKLKRGEKEEKFKVEVHRNNEGGFHLNKMDADH